MKSYKIWKWNAGDNTTSFYYLDPEAGFSYKVKREKGLFSNLRNDEEFDARSTLFMQEKIEKKINEFENSCMGTINRFFLHCN